MIGETIAQMSRAVARASAVQTDDVIRSAIIQHTGADDVLLADVQRLGAFTIYPDGTEVFSYNGVDLVRFWPMQFENEMDGISHFTRVSRQYELIR